MAEKIKNIKCPECGEQMFHSMFDARDSRWTQSYNFECKSCHITLKKTLMKDDDSYDNVTNY